MSNHYFENIKNYFYYNAFIFIYCIQSKNFDKHPFKSFKLNNLLNIKKEFKKAITIIVIETKFQYQNERFA